MCPPTSAMPQGASTPPSSTKSEHSHGAAESSTKASAENARAAATLRTRKRTKTGCLTCRRRRIKCGEERPVCGNCIKSKRSCEGYARPLTFRDPVAIGSTWGPRGMHRLESHPHLQPQIHSAGPRPYMTPQSASAAQTHFPIIAPRPTQPDMGAAYMHGPESMMWSQSPQVVYYSPAASALAGPASAPLAAGFGYSAAPPQSPMTVLHSETPTMHGPRPSMSWPAVSSPEQMSAQQLPMSTGAVLASTPAFAPELYRYDGVRSAPPQPLDEQQQQTSPQQTPAFTSASMSPVVMAPATDPLPSTGFEVAATYAPAPASPPGYYGPVDAEDSVPVPAGTAAQLPRHDYGLMLALAASREEQAIRSYDAFLEKPDILATYVPNYSASPLMDNPTARIFCHFITATAPFLSIFERHPVNPDVIFSGREIPRAQQAVWTYILPMMALNNQTLLQTMLALASLQIARLQNIPHTASMRHYHYALRKVSKAVSSPSKRTTIPTLAATLLLGHYEATTAEHAKWSSHLAGATQLFMEVDFVRPARQIRQLRAHENTEHWTTAYISQQFQQPPSNLPWVPAAGSSDEHVFTQLAGLPSPFEADEDLSTATPLTEKDMEDFQIHRDLFWFYVKQDIIQSCISGNALLLPYERWMHCAPRGPINKIDLAYGTMDHMLLLMGRVCHFAHKDQARKAEAEAAKAGSSENASYGLIPGVFPTAMPDAFKNAGFDQGHASSSSATAANDEFAAAEAEWTAIQAAFTLFEQSLGSAFAPLPADAAPPAIDTPFGAAIHYRTQQIATIWSFYYTARIIVLRTHPAMPASPAAAAEVVASKTGAWSSAIARIALGLQPPPADQPLNPSFGAALSESMLPLFFAGVEYKDTAQRMTTIERLRLIAERAGLESAMLVAQGLEQQWEQQAERGAGPPYTRTVQASAAGVLEHVDTVAAAAIMHPLSAADGSFMPSATAAAPAHTLQQPTSELVYVPHPDSTGLDELELSGNTKNWAKSLLGDEDPSQLGMAPMF